MLNTSYLLGFLEYLRAPQDIGDESLVAQQRRSRCMTVAAKVCASLIGIMAVNWFFPTLDLRALPPVLGGLPNVACIALIIAFIHFKGLSGQMGHRAVFEQCLENCRYETEASILTGYRVLSFYQISNSKPPESLISLAAAVLESRDPSKQKVLYTFSNQAAWMCRIQPGIINEGGTLPLEIRSSELRETVGVRLPDFAEEPVTYWLKQVYTTIEYAWSLGDIQRLKRILEDL